MVMTPSPILSKPISDIPGFRHAFFTRQGGVSSGIFASLNVGYSSGDERAAVRENRSLMADWLGTPFESLVFCHQIHSPTALFVDEQWETSEGNPHADSMVTNKRGLFLCVSAADCAPIILIDPVAKVVGVAHAGWKGALSGVCESTIELMKKSGSTAQDIVVCIGPCMQSQSFEIGEDLYQAYLSKDLNYRRFFCQNSSGKKSFDLAGFIIERFRNHGVAMAFTTGNDTYSEEGLFFSARRASHRGEGNFGRMASAIGIL